MNGTAAKPKGSNKDIVQTVRVPRYTSYPTALKFTDEIGAEQYLNWIKNRDHTQPLSLYIHIPYCREMCNFCGCFTKITQKDEPIAKYTASLIEEIKLFHQLSGRRRHLVSHLHFGGGSPSVLQPEQFRQIMQIVDECFEMQADAERAIELDPRTIDADKIKAYAKAGINRISIGVQDFDEQVQVAVNRIHSFDDVAGKIDLIRESGINSINIDLMYGLPYQNIAKLEQTVQKVLELHPDRLAVFAYAHVPWMRKHQRLIPEEVIPKGYERMQMIQFISQYLLQHGYEAIGIDHFALQEDSMTQGLKDKELRRNFQGYSTDKAREMVGLGISSISCLQSGFAQNSTHMTDYHEIINSGKLPIARGCKTSSEDLMRREWIAHIMCYLELDLSAEIMAYDLPEDYFAAELANLARLEEAGIISFVGQRIRVKQRLYARRVAAMFDQYISPEFKRELTNMDSEHKYLDIM
jgi:oxygen-independent coproporphyrinogen-3 oxidase